MKLRIISCFLTLWACATIVQAQWSYSLDATTYFHNAEFNTPYATGYTYPGFYVAPTLNYSIADSATIQGGILFNCIAGTQGIYQWSPLFQISYRPLSWLQLAMGTFTSTLTHYLPEPLISQEQWFSHPVENGIRIQTNTSFWHSHTWLDWEHYLIPWTNDQEIFTFGTLHSLHLLHAATDTLSINALLMARHHGGELTNTTAHTETIMHEMAALQWTHTTPRQEVITGQIPVFFFQNPKNPNNSTAYTHGWGLYPQLTIASPLAHHQKVHATLGYWHGFQWQAPLGNYEYFSISNYRPFVNDPHRSLLSLGLHYQKTFHQFSLHLQSNFYYDIPSHNLDYLVGIYLHFSLKNKLHK